MGGEAVCPIPSRAINLHCAHYDLDEAKRFLICIRAMDSKFMEHFNNPQPKSVPTKPMGPEMFDAMFGVTTNA